MIKRNEFWKLFKKVVLFSLVALIILFFYVVFGTESTIGINKTIGWAWDITNYNFWLGIFQFMIVIFLVIAIITVVLIKLKQFIK